MFTLKTTTLGIACALAASVAFSPAAVAAAPVPQEPQTSAHLSKVSHAKPAPLFTVQGSSGSLAGQPVSSSDGGSDPLFTVQGSSGSLAGVNVEAPTSQASKAATVVPTPQGEPASSTSSAPMSKEVTAAPQTDTGGASRTGSAAPVVKEVTVVAPTSPAPAAAARVSAVRGSTSTAVSRVATPIAQEPQTSAVASPSVPAPDAASPAPAAPDAASTPTVTAAETVSEPATPPTCPANADGLGTSITVEVNADGSLNLYSDARLVVSHGDTQAVSAAIAADNDEVNCR